MRSKVLSPLASVCSTAAIRAWETKGMGARNEIQALSAAIQLGCGQMYKRKVQLRTRKCPAMETDGLAYCSWLLTDKFKISPIFNPMIYYKLEYQVFNFLLSAQATL